MAHWDWSDGWTNTPTLQYSNTPRSGASSLPWLSLLFKPAEHLLGVLLKNFRLVLRREPRNALDVRPHIVVPLAGARIGLGTGAGPLGAEETTLGAADAKQELQRLDIVERGVEIELFQSLIESFRIVGTTQLRAPTADLIGHRASAVRNDQLQFGKIFKHLGVDQRQDRNALFGDEVAVKRFARIFTTCAVDQPRNIHSHHLFVKRIPVLVAHHRSHAVALARIGIDHDADETEIIDAAIDLFERVGDRYAGVLRQAADSAKLFWLH